MGSNNGDLTYVAGQAVGVVLDAGSDRNRGRVGRRWLHDRSILNILKLIK